MIFIFECALKSRELNMYQIQVIVKEKYLEHGLFSKLNNDEDMFLNSGQFGKEFFSGF